MDKTSLTEVGALFDLDGVLIDSETEYTRIWEEINRCFKSGYDDLALRIKGMTLDNIIKTYFPGEGMYRRVADMLHSMETEMRYCWKPGAKELLEWFTANDIPRVLVTSSDGKKMGHLREELPDLEPMMTHIITADMISRSKPDPEGYLLGGSIIGIPMQKCVVFEDSLQGVTAGKASGALVVGVAGTLPASVISPCSDIVVDSLKKIDPVSLVASLRRRSAL